MTLFLLLFDGVSPQWNFDLPLHWLDNHAAGIVVHFEFVEGNSKCNLERGIWGRLSKVGKWDKWAGNGVAADKIWKRRWLDTRQKRKENEEKEEKEKDVFREWRQWSWLLWLWWWGFGFGTKKGEIVWSVTPRPFSCSLKWKKKKNEKRRMWKKWAAGNVWCDVSCYLLGEKMAIKSQLWWLGKVGEKKEKWGRLSQWWNDNWERQQVKWQLSQCWNILAGCSIFEYLKNIFGISLNIFEYFWISLNIFGISLNIFEYLWTSLNIFGISFQTEMLKS